LLDISLPGRSGLDLLPDIKKVRPSAKVLVISIYNEDQYAIRALRSGASGYLMKSGAPEELIQAAFKVSQGGRYITADLAEKLAFNTFEDREKPLHEALSERELQVVRLLTEGKTTADVARILSLSPKTISTYRERILSKLDLKTTSDIIRYGLKEGIAGELI
jgi:DNA-binding NarL/FixJ family response regulator